MIKNNHYDAKSGFKYKIANAAIGMLSGFLLGQYFSVLGSFFWSVFWMSWFAFSFFKLMICIQKNNNGIMFCRACCEHSVAVNADSDFLCGKCIDYWREFGLECREFYCSRCSSLIRTLALRCHLCGCDLLSHPPLYYRPRVDFFESINILAFLFLIFEFALGHLRDLIVVYWLSIALNLVLMLLFRQARRLISNRWQRVFENTIRSLFVLGFFSTSAAGVCIIFFDRGDVYLYLSLMLVVVVVVFVIYSYTKT